MSVGSKPTTKICPPSTCQERDTSEELGAWKERKDLLFLRNQEKAYNHTHMYTCAFFVAVICENQKMAMLRGA